MASQNPHEQSSATVEEQAVEHTTTRQTISTSSDISVGVASCNAAPQLMLLTRASVKQKAAEGASWLIIDNNVYDVGEWASSHPGGEDVLQEYYGSDASMEFTAVGHSKQARGMLAQLKIGVLDKTDQINV